MSAILALNHKVSTTIDTCAHEGLATLAITATQNARFKVISTDWTPDTVTFVTVLLHFCY